MTSTTNFTTVEATTFNATDALQLNGTEVAGAATGLHALEKVVKVTLGVAAGGGGIISWANPEGAAIIVTRLVLDVTTAATGTPTIDCGMTATSGTTSADNLIDGASVASIALLDNITDAGTNGKGRQKVAAGKWVTGTASAATPSMVGSAYIYYIPA